MADMFNAKRTWYKDATGTAIVSPVAAGTSVVTLVWPAEASVLIVSTTTAAVRVANESNAANGYYTIAAGKDFSVAGKAGDTVYFLRPNSTDLIFEFIG